MRTSAEEDVVDKGVLEQRQEDEDEAAHQVDVDGLDVGDLGQGFPQVGVDGGHCQHSGDTCNVVGGKGEGGDWSSWF